ncbi:MAG: hypothetical protein ABIN01_24525 [Ferruginibacter sp.]
MQTGNLILKKLITVAIFAVLFFIFRYLFNLATPYYIYNAALTPHSIDAHMAECKCFFDAEYIRLAKYGGYYQEGFYKTFALIDLVFPIIYTTMFLTALAIHRAQRLYIYLKWLVIAGCVADYLENFSFAIYLQLSELDLAPVIAVFTSVKSVLFLVNSVVFITCVLYGLVLLLKAKNAAVTTL